MAQHLSAIAAALAIALVLSSTSPIATTVAHFYDHEAMRGGSFMAFGVGPEGLSIEPGKSKATWVSKRHAPFSPIARPADGSLELDFGEVTFDNSNMSSEVFRICNHSDGPRSFRVIVPQSLRDLFRDVAIQGGGTIRPGEESAVRMGVEGGARPPGTYSGTIVVRDSTDEFYRVLRVKVRILGTDETHELEEAVLAGREDYAPQSSVTPTEVAPAVPAPETEDERPASDPQQEVATPAEPVPEPKPDPEPKPKAEPDPKPDPEPKPAPPSGDASPSAG